MFDFDFYIINLDRSLSRWTDIKNQFDNQNITNYKRFSAIDGKSIKDSEYINLIDPKTIEIAERGYRNLHKEHNYGSIGCYLSHVEVWKEILKSGKEYGVIFEDDIILKKNFKKKFKKFIKNICFNWDLIIFGEYLLIENNNFKKKNQKCSTYEFLSKSWCCLNSYIIKSSCIKLLLKDIYPVKIQLDWWLSEQINYNFWILKKPIVELKKDINSDINHSIVISESKDMNLIIFFIVLFITIIIIILIIVLILGRKIK